jgi:hypothetical protein
MWKTKDHNVSETGSVSVLRWMGQDKPTKTHHRQNPFKSIQKEFLLTHMCSNRNAVKMKKKTHVDILTHKFSATPSPSRTIFLFLSVCEENIGEFGVET